MHGRSLASLVTVLWLFRQDMFILPKTLYWLPSSAWVGTNLGTLQQETMEGLAQQPP